MATPQSFSSRGIRSKITSEGTLELSLETGEIPAPGPGAVVVRVEAAPINPSDLGLFFGPADMTTAQATGTAEDPRITAQVPPHLLRLAKARLDQGLAVGNEGAGTVVAVGDSDDARALEGKTVGLVGGGMYNEYRLMPALMCLPLNEGTTAEQGASCFVNPLTALGMVETMRAEGHKALVHTAAASNLGQMLNRLCQAEGIEIVNIVRRSEQETILRDLGAAHVVNSSSDSFAEELVEALAATDATLAFDATGGGELTSSILSAMEAAQARNAKSFSPYGSTTYKQVYIYGGLDRSPTVLKRDYGMAWGIGGWLLTPFLEKIGGEASRRLMQRAADEIHTIFASSYAGSVSLEEALSLEAIARFGRMATGEKFLVRPHG